MGAFYVPRGTGLDGGHGYVAEDVSFEGKLGAAGAKTIAGTRGAARGDPLRHIQSLSWPSYRLLQLAQKWRRPRSLRSSRPAERVYLVSAGQRQKQDRAGTNGDCRPYKAVAVRRSIGGSSKLLACLIVFRATSHPARLLAHPVGRPNSSAVKTSLRPASTGQSKTPKLRHRESYRPRSPCGPCCHHPSLME